MRGRIKKYDSTKGFGFIIGEDNQDYFFHVSNVKTFDQPFEGAMLKFEPKQGEKGLTATEILIDSIQNRRPEVIKIKNVRIKLNNIKNYGSSSEERYYLPVYIEKKSTSSKFLVRLFSASTFILDGKVEISEEKAHTLERDESVPKLIRSDNNDIEDHSYETVDRTDLIYGKERYLYITTYQKDNYIFYESETDIDEVLKELDGYLG